MIAGWIVLVLLLWVVPMVVAFSIGKGKGRDGVGYGFWLGWIGVLILVVLPPKLGGAFRECPFCKERMRADATVCPHCQRDVEPLFAGLSEGSAA